MSNFVATFVFTERTPNRILFDIPEKCPPYFKFKVEERDSIRLLFNGETLEVGKEELWDNVDVGKTTELLYRTIAKTSVPENFTVKNF